MKNTLLLLAVILYSQIAIAQSLHNIYSPDGKIRVQIAFSDRIEYALYFEDELVVNPSEVGIDWSERADYGSKPKIRRKKEKEVNQSVDVFLASSKRLDESYNEAAFELRGRYSFEVRAYDQGVAFRFVNHDNRLDENVVNETFEVNLRHNDKVWASYPRTEDQFIHAYEDYYKETDVMSFGEKLAVTPLLVESEKVKLMITDADVYGYPVMYLEKSKSEKSVAANGLKAVFAPYPLKEVPGGHMDFHLDVTERADYVARKKGKFSLPWRLIGVAQNDADLLKNHLVYLLNRPADASVDYSWVKPGKVAWDWYNDWNLKGVPFKTGINTETYKYYIDFAAENGLDYINLDEGWSEQFDLLKYEGRPNFDLMEVISYAKQEGVGVFLWCIGRTLDAQMKEFMPLAESWGIAGLKVDFMDRDDQIMIDFYERSSSLAAKHHLLMNFHGAYKPTGMERQFPNIINREGVRGLEYNKFDPLSTTPEHAVTIPYIRGFAGHMDYTPGGMANAQKADWKMSFSRPMTQGTRCHQLAMYLVYNAPLVMLADAPTSYEAEPEILSWLTEVPNMWDETVPLAGKVGDFIVVARRKGTDWWVGVMTDGSPRKLEVDLSFLPKAEYDLTMLQDGPNADRLGEDYTIFEDNISESKSIEVFLAPGGGAVLKLSPKK